MATEKQKAVVDKIIENRGSISAAMREVGYSENTAHNPKNLTESKGFREVLEAAGLTPGLVSKALKEDIENKPGKRVQELNLAAEVLKMKGKDSDSGDKNLTINFISFNGNNDPA